MRRRTFRAGPEWLDSLASWCDLAAVRSVVVPTRLVPVDREASAVLRDVVVRAIRSTVERIGRTLAGTPGLEMVDLEETGPVLAPRVRAAITAEQDRLSGGTGEQPSPASEIDHATR